MPKTPNPSSQDLKQLAKKRLHEAEVLLANGKYEDTVYLCGYAIELALKARICKTLKWVMFPESEVQNPQTFKTHHLLTLLYLSGIQAKVLNKYKIEWATIENWSPEMRYVATPITSSEAQKILNSVKTLLKIL